jgi:hypothetical protein
MYAFGVPPYGFYTTNSPTFSPLYNIEVKNASSWRGAHWHNFTFSFAVRNMYTVIPLLISSGNMPVVLELSSQPVVSLSGVVGKGMKRPTRNGETFIPLG